MYLKLIGLLFLVAQVHSNLDYIDIGLEYSKDKEVYYWSRSVTIQLDYQIPKLPSGKYKEPRCDYARSSRTSLYNRFLAQFPRVTKFSVYQEKCRRFENVALFDSDNQDDCLKCFHINNENDPFYLECLMLLQMRSNLCKNENSRQKRDVETTGDNLMLSKIAVSLARAAKMQNDRVTTKFRQEHQLQKEGVNFQLLFLNTFRWQMSYSEVWFLEYMEADPKQFAKILVNLSGILPKSIPVTEKQLNTTISDEWSIESVKRNDSHVIINVTLTSYDPHNIASLYTFRYLPMNFVGLFFAVYSEDTYALQCGDKVVELSKFDHHMVLKKKFLEQSYCHTNLDVPGIQDCMKMVLTANSGARKTCVHGMQRLADVNNFYMTTDYKVWFPVKIQLTFRCPIIAESGQKTVSANSLLHPKCGCTYYVNNKGLPRTKTCSRNQMIKSNFTLISQVKDKPFFLGQINNNTDGHVWQESAVNKLTRELVAKTEMVQSYLEKKLKEEASTSANFEWNFRFGLSSIWLALPILGIIVFIGYIWCKCRMGGICTSSRQSQPSGPVIVNYCNHQNEGETVNIRPVNDYPKEGRVVSWPGERNALNQV